jgi:multidrug resistance efflux pump
MPGAPAEPWMVRTAGRIGVALATLTALSAATLSIVDQATFVTTTDARVRAHMVTVSAEAAGRLVDVLPAAGDRVKQGQVLARRHDRRARRVLAETSL